MSTAASDEPGELDLRDYLSVLRRRKATVGLTTLGLVVMAIAASLVQTKVYAATADVLLQAKPTESLFDPTNGQRNDPTRAVQTEIQVLRSRPVSDRVQQQIGFAPKVTAAPVGLTDVIAITAENGDPTRAALVANAYAHAYIDFRRTQAVDDLLAAADQIQAKVTDLQKRLDNLSDGPGSTPRSGPVTTNPEVASQRDSLLAQQALFRQKLDQLQVDAALKSGGAQLVTPALAPISPVRPTPKRNGVIALMIGLMLGVGLAFVREYLDDSLKTKEDVDRAAPGAAVLGLIPVLSGWKDKKSALVVSLSDPKSPAAEAYRALRTSVQFLGIEKKLRAIQVTSPSAAEGKSTTIANLAVALAGAGQRVVALDCDLRRPRIDRFFGLEHEVGLTSVLLGDIALEQALQASPEVERLSVLAAGPIPPNPSELLAGNQFRELLMQLEEQFDVVLIDCPPVLPVTDATVLAAWVDGTLLVVTAGQTQRRELHRAAEMLQQVHAPLLGVVFNGVSDDGGYGYSYGYRYAYSSESTPKSGRRSRSQGRRRQSGPRDGAGSHEGVKPRPAPAASGAVFDQARLPEVKPLAQPASDRLRAAENPRGVTDRGTAAPSAPEAAARPAGSAASATSTPTSPPPPPFARPEVHDRYGMSETPDVEATGEEAEKGLTVAARQLLEKYGMPSEPPAPPRRDSGPTSSDAGANVPPKRALDMPRVPTSDSPLGRADEDDVVKWWERPPTDVEVLETIAEGTPANDDVVAALERALWTDDPRWTSP